MKAIFKKELRDVIRWTPAGIVLGVVMVWMSLPTEPSSASSFDTTLASQLGLCGAIVAIAYGFLQSLFDIRNDSRGYLLHRPIDVGQIYFAKLASGFVAYVMTLAVPIGIAAAYVGFYGIDFMPLSAWQVIPACIACLFVFLLHPTAMLCANRDARWVGTRLLPAAGVVACILFLIGILWDGWSNTWLLRILELMAIGFPVAIVIVWAGRHAFACDTQLPPASFHGRRSVACVILLTVSSVVVYTAVTTFILESYPKSQGDQVVYGLDVGPDNKFRVLQTTQSQIDWKHRYATRPIDTQEPFQYGDIVPADSIFVYDGLGLRSGPFRQFVYLGRFSNDLDVVASRDRLYVYYYGQLKGVITPDGGFRDVKKATGGFSKYVAFRNTGKYFRGSYVHLSHSLFSDANGIYQVDFDDLSIRQLAKGEFESLNVQMGSIPSTVWAKSGDQLIRFSVRAHDPADPLPSLAEAPIQQTNSIMLPQIDLEKVASYAVDLENSEQTSQILSAPDGSQLLVRQSRSGYVQYRDLDSSGRGEYSSTRVPATELQKRNLVECLQLLCIPPSVLGGMICGFGRNEFRTLPPIGLIALNAIVAAALCWLLTTKLGLKSRRRLWWTIAAALLGLGTLLAVIAIYPKLVREACPRCDKDRRVDLDDCEHCGNAWDPPADEGIEIMQRSDQAEHSMV